MNTGELLSGRYRLVSRVAVGGMGEVWQATDEVLGREVAVKVLKREYAGDATFRTRFRGEARFSARLSHHGIAQVYDYGEQDDQAYLVMEMVRGQPLSAVLSRGGRLRPETTLDILGQAARALQVAHDAEIIHRDIKPGNLMITPQGEVKITDFGIARAVQSNTLTQTGMVMGTAQYVSPEQASGQPLTPASDIYSLGVVGYECLAGSPPFNAETPVAIALAHVREAPPELPEDVPPPIADLVLHMMAKSPQNRPWPISRVAARTEELRAQLGYPTGAVFDELPEEQTALAADRGPRTPTDMTGAVPAGEDWEPRRSRGPLILAACLGVVIIAVAALLAFHPWSHSHAHARFSGNQPGNTSSPHHHRHSAPPVTTPSTEPSTTEPGQQSEPPSTGPSTTAPSSPSHAPSAPPSAPHPTHSRHSPQPTHSTSPPPAGQQHAGQPDMD